jgi:hypothetical protein
MKDEVWEVEKGLECHGWVMGHAWGSHGEHGRWVIGPKHYMFWWDMFQGSSCPAIKMHAGPPAKTWHVSSEWQVLRFMTCRWNNVRVKIYVAAMEAPRKKGKTGWNLVYHQNWWFWWVWSPIECQCIFFAGFFLISPSVWWPNSGFWCCIFLTLWTTLLWSTFFKTFRPP